jgi:hypothetical protein
MCHLEKQIQYDTYPLNIRRDLQIYLIVGYINFCCFFCESDSRAWEGHYSKKQQQLRKQVLIQGQKNVESQLLVNSKNILLLTLHVNIGLIKQSVKAVSLYEREISEKDGSNWPITMAARSKA